MNPGYIEQAAQALEKILGPELTQIIEAIAREPGPDNPYFIDLPDSKTVDLDPMDLASYVARTSNTYGRMARFAGMARAQYKRAEGRYRQVLKTSAIGRNKEERESNAMKAAEEEYANLMVIDSVVELAESMEAASRIASESARKLYDKVENMKMAERREGRGYLQDRDFSTH